MQLAATCWSDICHVQLVFIHFAGGDTTGQKQHKYQPAKRQIFHCQYLSPPSGKTKKHTVAGRGERLMLSNLSCFYE